MSTLDKEHESASSTVELSTIVVDKSENTERGSCWEYNVSEQFPIKSAPASSGFVVIEVDKPHEGYSIETTMKNSKMNGEATIRSDSNVLIAILNYVDGIASGPCTLYDNDGILYFEGYFENGYREGRGKVYDETERKTKVRFDDVAGLEEEKGELIAKLISAIDEINFDFMDSKIDLLGDAYEYLIGQFAASAGKKAGEFYTPQQVSKLLSLLVTKD